VHGRRSRRECFRARHHREHASGHLQFICFFLRTFWFASILLDALRRRVILDSRYLKSRARTRAAYEVTLGRRWQRNVEIANWENKRRLWGFTFRKRYNESSDDKEVVSTQATPREKPHDTLGSPEIGGKDEFSTEGHTTSSSETDSFEHHGDTLVETQFVPGSSDVDDGNHLHARNGSVAEIVIIIPTRTLPDGSRFHVGDDGATGSVHSHEGPEAQDVPAQGRSFDRVPLTTSSGSDTFQHASSPAQMQNSYAFFTSSQRVPDTRNDTDPASVHRAAPEARFVSQSAPRSFKAMYMESR
jgi:hypothetical protein